MYMDASFYWPKSDAEPEEIAPGLDPHCLLCGKSLEGQDFIWDGFMGPQVDCVGMHLLCAYRFCNLTLRDLAATWHLNPTELETILANYRRGLDADALSTPECRRNGR
jgi:hypothetical protein